MWNRSAGEWFCAERGGPLTKSKQGIQLKRHQRIQISIILGLLMMATTGAKSAEIEQDHAVPEAQIPGYIKEAVNSPDRPTADRQLDSSRKPEQLIAFLGIKPGMKVADLWAGGGYTTELRARTVGPDGKVYSQNLEFPERLKKAGECDPADAACEGTARNLWRARVKEPGMSNVVEVTKPFDSPDLLPVPPGSLDAVVINMNYHDLVGFGFDRDKINHAVFTSLKPGGIYGLVDNSAKPGTGASDASTLHRIDENFEVNDIEKAGFRLAATSDILRNPDDPRTQPFYSKSVNHMQDRFVLKFVKP